MENRRSSYNRPPGQRRQFKPKRGPGGHTDDSRGNTSAGGHGGPGGRRRFMKKRSAATDAKMPPPRPGTRPRTTKPWEKVKRVKITSEFQITDGRYNGKLLQNIEKLNAEVSARKIREAMFRLLVRKIRAG